MSRAQRLEDVSCAICMDTLFNKRDDLDDLMTIATPDCGHVFHEECLLEWFRTQSLQYVAQAREQGLRLRGGSPNFSDAPNECPTCRTECFADPETGEPSVHRLFIHFGDGDGVVSSSQAGSSPVKWRGTQGPKGKEKEVMGLARRARGLMEEVKGLSGDSPEGEVEGILRRAEGLKEDAVSVKALAGVKTYIGGLNAAISNLRATLESHPLVTTLNNRIHELESAMKEMDRQAQRVVRTVLPQEIQKAVAVEQARADRRIRKVQEECELIKRELEREQVARRVGRKAMEEREREADKKVAELKKDLAREQADREFLSNTLNDRNKLLKLYHAKVESRRELKSQVEDLRVENSRLRADLESRSSQSGSPRRQSRQRLSLGGILDELVDEDEDTNADLSIQEIPADSFLPSQLKSRIPRSHRHAQDTSLQVDMPLDEKPPHALEIEDEPRSSSRSNPTARTYSFGRDEPKERKSKYFPSHKDEDDENEDVIVHASSSPSPPKRSRTNPFTTTREASDKRRDLPRRSNLHSSKERPIELISPSRPLAVARDRNLPQKAGRSMVDWLGISDSNGRPNKGVVGGTKAKRRV